MGRCWLRGLLLGLSVVCLVMVAPTAVLTQRQAQARSGGPHVDGVLSAITVWNEATNRHFSGDARQAIAIQRIQGDLRRLYGEARPEVVSAVRPRLS
jgi:hypothetical protein